MFEIELGVFAKDRLTGFYGVVMGRSEYSTGCRTYAIAPAKMDKEGKTAEWLWFDEDRIEIDLKKKPMQFGIKINSTGGPDMPHQIKY
jgi:hypothetical protein